MGVPHSLGQSGAQAGGGEDLRDSAGWAWHGCQRMKGSSGCGEEQGTMRTWSSAALCRSVSETRAVTNR